MTNEEYGDFVLRYKGCGACFPMYHTLSRFEKMWFSAIQKDVAELEKENAELKMSLKVERKNKSNVFAELNDETAQSNEMLMNEVADLKKKNAELNKKLSEAETDFDKMFWQKNEIISNAKEIIKKLKALYLSPVVTKDDIKRQDEILEEAEQFLNSEVEK